MDDLIEQMKVFLASTFALYLKAHNFHWNVEGSNFPQYHDFFGEIYDELWNAVDDIAEQIRQLNAFSPGSLGRFSQLSLIKDELNVPDAKSMIERLQGDNDTLIAQIKKVYELCSADEENEQIGLENFIQDRMMAHTKLGWKLRSTLAAM